MQYSPSLSYEFAWSYVELYNRPWLQEPGQPPITLVDIYGAITAYQKQQDDLRYRKIDFHEFLHDKLRKLRAEHGKACLPRPGLHEFRIIEMQAQPWLLFPADLNSGWQSERYLEELAGHTICHGYVADRSEAIRLHARMIA